MSYRGVGIAVSFKPLLLALHRNRSKRSNVEPRVQVNFGPQNSMSIRRLSSIQRLNALHAAVLLSEPPAFSFRLKRNLSLVECGTKDSIGSVWCVRLLSSALLVSLSFFSMLIDLLLTLSHKGGHLSRCIFPIGWGGLTRIGQIRRKQPIKERSGALADAVHDAELPTN
uniref:Uncharacterized protein n=1 Tax=Utricularia reniformis TaxID=192314 RepID=A0A1Y0AZ41_9LAMI|nr:hypothetical protein AEK19_MT1927 [Utricularia reniformis]ART30417.1 hypothetical protein AEK19_MT1927 [Utricularia reniformis]